MTCLIIYLLVQYPAPRKPSYLLPHPRMQKEEGSRPAIAVLGAGRVTSHFQLASEVTHRTKAGADSHSWHFHSSAPALPAIYRRRTPYVKTLFISTKTNPRQARPTAMATKVSANNITACERSRLHRVRWTSGIPGGIDDHMTVNDSTERLTDVLSHTLTPPPPVLRSAACPDATRDHPFHAGSNVPRYIHAPAPPRRRP